MVVIENLKIIPHNGFENPTEIKNLGKINVFCGKNNSGKSSILAAINNEKLREIGFSSSEHFISRATNIGFQFILNKNRNGYETIELKHAFNSCLKKKEVWYSGDKKEFIELMSREIESTRAVPKSSINHLDKVYDSIFAGTIKSILIPPKRMLETNININGNQVAEPIGRGIVNQLFLWKSQEPESDLYKRFIKMRESFEEISEGHKFDIFMNERNQVRLMFCGKESVYRDSMICGLGLQDLLILLFHSLWSKENVLLLEEPENHVHPDWQRKLLNFILETCKSQLFIATHSSVFLDNMYVNKSFLVAYNQSIAVQDITNKAEALQDLGYSVTDNILSDLIILTEGPTDIPLLEELLRSLGKIPRRLIKFWPLGGDIMDKTDLSVLSQGSKIVAIVDADPKSASVRKRFERKCGELKIPCFILKRYAIENYIPLRVLNKIFPGQIPEGLELSPNVKLEEQIGFSVKKSNRIIGKEINVEEIEGTDLYEILNGLESFLT